MLPCRCNSRCLFSTPSIGTFLWPLQDDRNKRNVLEFRALVQELICGVELGAATSDREQVRGRNTTPNLVPGKRENRIPDRLRRERLLCRDLAIL
jgi:hypothetical protein